MTTRSSILKFGKIWILTVRPPTRNCGIREVTKMETSPDTCPMSGKAHSPAIVSRCGGPTPEELNVCGICGSDLTMVRGAWIAISDERAFSIRAGRVTIACECDYSLEDGRFMKISRHCPLHDNCQWCGDNLGSILVDRDWVCESCSKEEES